MCVGLFFVDERNHGHLYAQGNQVHLQSCKALPFLATLCLNISHSKLYHRYVPWISVAVPEQVWPYSSANASLVFLDTKQREHQDRTTSKGRPCLLVYSVNGMIQQFIVFMIGDLWRALIARNPFATARAEQRQNKYSVCRREKIVRRVTVLVVLCAYNRPGVYVGPHAAVREARGGAAVEGPIAGLVCRGKPSRGGRHVSSRRYAGRWAHGIPG